MDKSHVIMLNAPPRSGKDAAGKHFAWTRNDIVVEKMAKPIKEALTAFLQLTPEEFKHYDNDYKDTRCARMLGKTFRELCIDFSELFVKKSLENQAFGTLLSKRITDYRVGLDFNHHFVITDCGFDSELVPVLNNPEVKVSLVKLYRPDCDFSNDSRRYIRPETMELIGLENCYEVHNVGTEKDFLEETEALFTRIIGY
jgi:hypothetical protein